MSDVETLTPPLFRSLDSALTFAYNATENSPAREAYEKIAAPGRGSGKGLAGLDAAAQSGMIRSIVKSCGNFNEALAIARFAPAWRECHCGRACCSGRSWNWEWKGALDDIQDALKSTVLANTRASYEDRIDCVARFYGKDSRTFSRAISKDRHTEAAYYSRVKRFLGGDGKSDGAEAVALHRIEKELKEAGLI